MSRGPDKQFDPEIALDKAMQLFWAKGYAATGLSELLETMGIGRKSLYDTFGNKRALYIKDRSFSLANANVRSFDAVSDRRDD